MGTHAHTRSQKNRTQDLLETSHPFEVERTTRFIGHWHQTEIEDTDFLESI